MRREPRIATNVFNTGTFYDTWRPRRQGEAEEGGNQRYRNALPLDFFRYRCTATITGASGSDHYNRVDIRLLELNCHLLAYPFRVSNGGAPARRREVLVMNRADDALIFERTH